MQVCQHLSAASLCPVGLHLHASVMARLGKVKSHLDTYFESLLKWFYKWRPMWVKHFFFWFLNREPVKDSLLRRLTLFWVLDIFTWISQFRFWLHMLWISYSKCLAIHFFQIKQEFLEPILPKIVEFSLSFFHQRNSKACDFTFILNL